MKKALVFITLLGLMISATQAENARPKIGLVLSGGGARGFAHIGTLRMIDSLQIPIDYIVGTSMGGIMGALYAIGYDAVEIENIVTSVQWEKMFADDPPRNMLPYPKKFDDGLYQLEFGMPDHIPTAPSGLIRGQQVSLLFSRLAFAFEHAASFDSLPIPYRCMTVDLISGREVILKDGSLAQAMRSTMSIPSLFNPVEYGDSLLIDGGLLNNLPIDVAKDMGSDVIIAVNCGRPKKTKDELGNLLAILEQSITIPEYIKEEENIKLADLLISPKLAELKPTVFTQKNVKAIIEEGHRRARAHLQDFEALIETHDLRSRLNRFQSKLEPSRLHGVVIAGNTTLPFHYVYSILGLNAGDSLTYAQLQSHMRSLRISGHFRKVDYDIELDENEDVHLEVRVKELEMPRIGGFRIYGNRSLSFGYLYNFLNIKPGDVFNIDLLENKLTELYSLGYHETVNYQIEPMNKDAILLNIHVKEKENESLSVGFHYDNYHHLVGHLRYINANTIFQGLRIQNHLDFAGLTHLRLKALYPNGIDGFIFYPFIQMEYTKEPITIHNEDRAIAVYNDKYIKLKMGLGLWPEKSSEIEFGMERVRLDIAPEIGMPGLPEWKHDLTRFTSTLAVDRLDRSLIPNKGWKLNADYEWSSPSLLSDIEFTRFEMTLDAYKPLDKHGNLHLRGHFGVSSGIEALNYLWFYTGGPESFVGIDYLRLAWYRMANMRIDYRYRLNKQTYFKAIYNLAPNFTWLDDEMFYPESVTSIHGLGVGLVYDSTIGPIQLIYSRGDNELEVEKHFQSGYLYFTVGMHF